MESVRIVNCRANETEGLIALTLDAGMPVGLTVYGSLVTGAGSLGDEVALPYERPTTISNALAGKGSGLTDDDQLRFEEVVARRRAWSCVPRDQNRNLEIDQLLEINRGLVELTAEIVHRGRKRSRDEPTRFGLWQLNMGALAYAAAELRELRGSRRDNVFDQMIERERAEPEKRSSLVAGKPAWVQEQEQSSQVAVLPALAPPSMGEMPIEGPVSTDDELAMVPSAKERSSAVPVTVGALVVFLIALVTALSTLL